MRLLRWLPLLVTAAIIALAAQADGTPATARSVNRTPPELRTGLRAGLQLAAMRAGMRAAPDAFPGRATDCGQVTPVLAIQPGDVMAGNFRDASGGCYVWLNLGTSPLLTGREICKLVLHEMGHLNGLQHSQDPGDVMYSPFSADPIPAGCDKPFG